jgi:hypothetical protein
VDGEQAKLVLHFCISLFCYIGKPAYLSMPKFLAGCHYNEEDISPHLKKNNRILAGPNEWQQVWNRSNPPQKPVEVVKGRILASCAQKSPEPWEERVHDELRK